MQLQFPKTSKQLLILHINAINIFLFALLTQLFLVLVPLINFLKTLYFGFKKMKRQRKVGNAQDMKSTKAMAKKKGKREVEKLEEERKNDCGESSPGMLAESYQSWDDLPWFGRGVVDEQMSWGSIWLPIWDVEYYMGEACSEMSSDVVWDYDIWNLRSINQVPNP